MDNEQPPPAPTTPNDEDTQSSEDEDGGLDRKNYNLERVELLPEEAIYLVERGSLFCWKDSALGISGTQTEMAGAPMSVQQVYAEMLGVEVLTLEKLHKPNFIPSLASLFCSLRLMPTGHRVPLHHPDPEKRLAMQKSSPYQIFFNLYKPSMPFKRHDPTGNEKDITMQAGQQKGALPLTRKFNEHSERLLNSALNSGPAAKRQHLEAPEDEYAHLELDNLRNPKAAAGIVLEMQDRQRYFKIGHTVGLMGCVKTLGWGSMPRCWQRQGMQGSGIPTGGTYTGYTTQQLRDASTEFWARNSIGTNRSQLVQPGFVAFTASDVPSFRHQAIQGMSVTRSGTIYAAWNPVSPANPDFCFESALKQGVSNEEAYLDNFISTCSPLSSAPTSRSPSPSPDWEPSSLLAPAGFLSPNLATYPEVSLCVLNTDSRTEPAGPPPSSSGSIPPPNVPSNSRPNKRKRNQQSPSAINSRKEKNKKHAKKKKKLVRQEEAEANRLVYGNFVRPEVRAKHTGFSTTVATGIETENLKAASSGYVGVHSQPPLRQYMLEELVGPNSLGLHLVTNCGPEARHIVDNSNRIVGVYAGQLNNPDWIEQLARATTLLEKARAEGDFTVDESHHSRGDFPTLASGVAHGGGTKGPCNQRPSQRNNTALVDELLTVFERLAIHASVIFATWAPKLHAYYFKIMKDLHAKYPGLKQNWNDSVFASAVWNLGPHTVCHRHKDAANLPFGLCAVTALGNFDATKGGHLVLWDLGLVIEFPPGSTILLPSAVIEHSNIPIQEHETRYSFTQYSSGGLFQWAEHGMQNNKDFFKGMSNEELQKVKSDDAQRWKFGLSLFSTYKELRNMGAGVGVHRCDALL
ncbi:hypothetical protein DXG01_016045 [Tephrocybe rancida]|nr:hypothetical protein DXG01_016045 [Tephrocybe rancida]